MLAEKPIFIGLLGKLDVHPDRRPHRMLLGHIDGALWTEIPERDDAANAPGPA